MDNLPFRSADILIPKTDLTRFAAIACDQFTSQPDYWKRADDIAGDAPSALRITLPEIYLSDNVERRVAEINENMRKYLEQDVFEEYKDALIFVERTLPDGKVRLGIVGACDLEQYSFEAGAKTRIRPTEETVLERIPPRVEIRKNAPLELPHVMLLIDDPRMTVIKPLSHISMPVLYDFELMLGGGHIRGSLITGEAKRKVMSAFDRLDHNFTFAVGDGNHSLATAKRCYELNPNELTRYALVEVVNIHDEALTFEPIYRLLFGIKPAELYASLKAAFPENEKGSVRMLSRSVKGTVDISGFPVAELQAFLDGYVKTHDGARIDYIHGEDVLRMLALDADDRAGFIFDGMKKSELFPEVEVGGVLPRKAFSMGEAASKRYYIEARKIK